MRNVLKGAAAGLAIALLATAAQAGTTVLVFDDFEAYGAQPGFSGANFTAFTDLNVTDGTVDVLQDVGALATPTGTGFVDLDGSTNDGGYLRTDAFAFQAGDVVTFEVDFAGNRRGAADSFLYGFRSAGMFTFNDVTITRGAVVNTTSSIVSNSFGGAVNGLGAGAPWTHLSFSFTAGSAGSLSAYAGTSSADGAGPLVDNFKLSVIRPAANPGGGSGAPEPAAWAMMILGFTGVGSLFRRRRPLPLARHGRACPGHP